jgi:uncharacterized membrane protein
MEAVLSFMELLPFAMIMVSAAFHALWNFLAKGSREKEPYMLLANLSSQVTVLPIFLMILGDWGFPMQALPFLLVSGVAEVAYFISLSRAYEEGDLSIVYPVVRSSPMFVAILAYAFLGERLSTWGVAGILIIVAGVYVLHMREGGGLLGPLGSLRGSATMFALAAALGTTVYSLMDKLGVEAVDPIRYAFWLEIFVCLMLAPVIIGRKGFMSLAGEWRFGWSRICASGFLMRVGYIFALYTMTLAPVSYILALRQVSVVLGTVLGVAVLRESYGRQRLLGSVIIFVGVYVLGALA